MSLFKFVISFLVDAVEFRHLLFVELVFVFIQPHANREHSQDFLTILL